MAVQSILRHLDETSPDESFYLGLVLKVAVANNLTPKDLLPQCP